MNSIITRVSRLCNIDSCCHFNITKIFYSKDVKKRFIGSKAQSFQALPERKIDTYEDVYIPHSSKIASDLERNEFYSFYPNIIQDLTESSANNSEVHDHYMNFLQSNLPEYSQALGSATVASYKAFESPQNLTPENIQLANILGWCVDLLHGFWKLNQNIMCERCELPGWYKNVGLRAINDAVFIEHAPYMLLKKHLSGHRCYAPIMEWFNEVILKTSLGCQIENMCILDGKPQLNIFTPDMFSLIAKYKVTYPELLLPIVLGMKFSEKCDAKFYKEVRSILIKLGEYIEAQNHILDCYGNALQSDGVRNDINKGKCTWLIVQALQRATVSQRNTLSRYYGRSHTESVAEVGMIYADLNIFEAFLGYGDESLKNISEDIECMPETFLQTFFFKLVQTVYGVK